MNTKKKLNSEYDLLSFRLHSPRRKKRMQHEDFEKNLIALNRERDELYKQLRNLGWVELNPPIMRGWKRYFVLREDIVRSKHAALFENILSKINKIEYSNRKDFKVKKRKLGRRTYVVREQQLLQPNERQFKELNFSEKERQFFEQRYVREKWMKQPAKVYVFTEPWRFVLSVRPYMITKVRARDEEIERRLKEIDNYLQRNNLHETMSHLLYGRGYKWRDNEKSEKEGRAFKNWTLQRMLDAEM